MTIDRDNGRPYMRLGWNALWFVFALLACTAPSLRSAAAEDFFQGKTITIVVGFSPGGGFDIFARLLSRHISDFIPGHPTVVVKNMPGAGTITAVRYLATAPKDGTTIAAFHFGLIGQSRLTPDRVPMDFRKFAWLGSISQDLSVCYTWSALDIKDLAKLKARKDLHFGLSGIGTNDDVFARILKWVFGVDLQQVGGYAGSADVRLAVERGELDGDCGAWSSIPEDWILNKRINPVFRTAEFIPADMPKDIPYMMDLVANERDRAIIRLIVSDRSLGRPYIVAPDVPAAEVATLRTAFDETMNDPGFRADAENLRLPISPKNAQESTEIVEAIYDTPPDIVAAAVGVMTR
jgi:tripartite-type tricarboxylate transporter receptor subunit TctC